MRSFALSDLARTAIIAFPAAAQEPINFGRTNTINSEALGETRTINVWVSPHADKDKRAPRDFTLCTGRPNQIQPHQKPSW